ncbi:MAG: adenosine kinase [Cyanobacteria bacterium P01_H01_bin.121]
MTLYDVYGLGNALLDIECEVTPETLQELGIDKGVMTLLDEDQQHKVLGQIDGAAHKRSSGGSAANTMIAIQQFGGQSFYSCKIANDAAGQHYYQDLRDCGVTTNLEQQVLTEGVTGKCLVLVTPDADRTMNTFLGISATFSDAELVPDAIAASKYTYIEGYLVTGDASRQATIKARDLAQAAGQRVALSLSDYNMTKFFRDGLLEIIGTGIDFIFANESEALCMAQTEDLNEAIAYLKTLSQQFAITRGPQGSLIFDGATLIDIAAYPVQAIDTVGAGDMYAGALLYCINHGQSFAEAGQLASQAAAEIVTHLGARLPTATVKTLLADALSKI